MRFAAYAMPSYCEGWGLTEGEILRATIDHLASAEALGFHALWVNEHHFHEYGGLMPSLPTMLAALAQRTATVRLGTSVVLLPLHHPVEVAEQLAMVDLMSGGRVEFGVGRGFVAHDYEVMGVPYEDAQDHLLESLEVVRAAWSGQTFTHQGRYYQITDVRVWPRPEQRPHPPIWIACANTPASFDWTGTQGYNLLTIGYNKPLVETGKLARVYREAWAAAGHARAPTIATHYHVAVAEDREEARRIAEGGIAEHVRLNRASRALGSRESQELSPPPELPSVASLVGEGRLIAGTPDDCAQILRWASEEIGCAEAHCIFQFGDIPFAVAQRSMELFAAEVMPHLRAAAPAGAPIPR